MNAPINAGNDGVKGSSGGDYGNTSASGISMFSKRLCSFKAFFQDVFFSKRSFKVFLHCALHSSCRTISVSPVAVETIPVWP
jgi:hypothetical protein